MEKELTRSYTTGRPFILCRRASREENGTHGRICTRTGHALDVLPLLLGYVGSLWKMEPATGFSPASSDLQGRRNCLATLACLLGKWSAMPVLPRRCLIGSQGSYC